MYGAPIYVLYTFVPVDPYIWMENDVVVVVVVVVVVDVDVDMYVLYTFVPVDPYIWMENDVVVVVVVVVVDDDVDVDMYVLYTFVPVDPYIWMENDVGQWLQWLSHHFGLPDIDLEKFKMSGKELCELRMEDFIERTHEYMGDIVYEYLCKFKEGVCV